MLCGYIRVLKTQKTRLVRYEAARFPVRKQFVCFRFALSYHAYVLAKESTSDRLTVALDSGFGISRVRELKNSRNPPSLLFVAARISFCLSVIQPLSSHENLVVSTGWWD